MHIVIAGGHGQIALLLARQLSQARHDVTGLIRDTEQEGDLAAHGASATLLDLEAASVGDYADALAGADAVVFAAGAGPDSGNARKQTVDFGAAVKLADAAVEAGVGRYVMLSSMGAGNPPDVDPEDPDADGFEVYLDAKARADRQLQDSALAWTIVRPGRLTDDEATDRVTLGHDVGRGEVPRADVAAVLARILEAPATEGQVLEVIGGDTPVAEAVTAVRPT